ncbi:NfeD family protein, partial [Paramuribaculum intestinale]
MLAALMLALAATCEAAVKVYRIDLDEEIGATTWQFTRAGLQAARERGADLVLVHLNTYGGEVGAADSIRTALLHCGIPTMAFVDNNAASAGALIALACDTVIMRPDATMGAATVVNGTDGQAMPDKYQSYMRGIMRATAESHGKVLDADGRWRWRRDPVIAEAMVDPRVEVDGLIDDTRVLTFTPDEAVRWGYADGKADNVAEALAHIGVESFEIQRYQPTWVDRLTGFFGSPGVQAILIMIIVGGIYFELQTPGMGFPSMAALGAAVLYFLPLYISGVVSSWIVVVFVVGLL